MSIRSQSSTDPAPTAFNSGQGIAAAVAVWLVAVL